MFANFSICRRFGRRGIAVALGSAMSSLWAQTCEYTITSAPSAVTPPVTSVPSLSLIGIALLVVAIAFVAWRRGKFPGAKMMAVALLITAATLANQGGGGLVQRAYAAVVGLTNPAGESMTTSAASGEVSAPVANNPQQARQLTQQVQQDVNSMMQGRGGQLDQDLDKTQP